MKHRLVTGLIAALGLTLATPAATPSSGAEPPPNIVVIMVDDMRADDMAWMPRTQRLLGKLELTDFVSNHPLCCPARAEFLTGQFGHHNGVHHNPGASGGGYEALRDPDNTVARWFDDAGYATSLAGKFMNGWTPELPQPDGWDRFSVLTRNTYSGYDFDVWRDGVERTYTQLHNNDFVTRETISQISAAAEEGSPYFHFAAYTSPHGYVDAQGEWLNWPVPAVRHEGMFKDVKPPSKSSPSFEPVPDYPVTKVFRQRIRSLQSVDEGVGSIVRATRRNGTFDNTVFVFTSDNGYLLGEHGMRGKNLPFEESLRVPLLASGPGIPRGDSDKGGMITDLAPSLSALAGVEPGREQDGRDDLFDVGGGWAQILIQAGSDKHEWWWRGVREDNWVYVRYLDRRPMLFNLRRDPYQLENLQGQKPAVEERLRSSFPEVENHQRTKTRRVPLARLSEPTG
jgi:N-acetylglucosamine-6-sulfatase